ncbi:MAG: hypothetical protein H0V40_11890 [Actinobacteria bacterium]|nr:hypothetical protein [Actinomycetota bacterium]
MAEDLDRVPPAERQALLPVEPSRREGGSYPVRFALAYLALAVVAGAGIGGAIVLLDRPGQEAGPAWSSWRPTGSEGSYPEKIAEHVSERYRRPSGAQLVTITYAGEPKVQDVPLRAVAIQDQAGSTQGTLEIDKGLLYTLCGLGPSCSFREGDPADRTLQLMRREALELALYSFRYTDAKSVIALLPPSLGNLESRTDDAKPALFFQKQDLESELERPLGTTLYAAQAARAAKVDPGEGLVVDRLTEPRFFNYDLLQSQEGSLIMALTPLVLQG